jgi:NTE family protein
LKIGWMSGTSAGAVNAVAIAHGLAHGGPEKAIETLSAIWRGVIEAQVPDLVKLNPFMSGLVRAAPPSQMGAMLSPYEFNPAGFDPLRRLLERTIDFDAVRAGSGGALLIAATDVATGRKRVFETAEVTVEAVLASACLPMLQKAVVIDGRAYWDGGYSANPDLLSLAYRSPIRDTLLVMLNPREQPRAPRTVREISDRVETIGFNQPLLRDIEEIVRAQTAPGDWSRRSSTWVSRIRKHRFHVIEAGRHVVRLHSDTKFKADTEVVAHLYQAGLGEAHKWVENNAAQVGRISTADFRDWNNDQLGKPEGDALA